MGALPSVNVTWCFCWVVLGDWVCNQMVPLWWEVAWGTPWCPADLDHLHHWLLEHQWLLECWWLPEHCWLMEQLKYSFLSLSMTTAARAWQLASPHYGQHPLTWILFQGHELFICAAVSCNKLWLGIRLGDVGWHLSASLLWLCGQPLKLEAYFEWVKNTVAEVFCGSLLPPASPR